MKKPPEGLLHLRAGDRLRGGLFYQVSDASSWGWMGWNVFERYLGFEPPTQVPPGSLSPTMVRALFDSGDDGNFLDSRFF